MQLKISALLNMQKSAIKDDIPLNGVRFSPVQLPLPRALRCQQEILLLGDNRTEANSGGVAPVHFFSQIW